jgi:Outer membrane lipoprotein carrier protein LolA-like
MRRPNMPLPNRQLLNKLVPNEHLFTTRIARLLSISPRSISTLSIGAVTVGALAIGMISANIAFEAHAQASSVAQTKPVFGSDWILRALARPAPMRTDFVEVRDSPMLKSPLRLSGEYRRPDERTLVRDVRAPYREITTIVSSTAGAGQASIARDGKPARTFSLSRAPELASLQNSFGALLAGDRVGLERAYRLTASGTTQRWTLALAPKDAALAARLRQIVLYGQGAELRCIETQPSKGPLQRTLLASAALAVKPASDAKALETLCRVGTK